MLDVLTYCKRQATIGRLRLVDAFRDYDKARRGVCSSAGFKCGLTALGIELSAVELQELAQLYNTPEGHFRYMDFCNEVEGSIVQDIRKEEVQRIGVDRAPPQEKQVVIEDHAHDKLTPEERKKVERVQRIVMKQIKVQGINLWSVFHGISLFRVTVQGHVTIRQYIRAMDILQLKAVTKEEVFLTCKCYCDTPRGDEFNYVDFCAACDPGNARPSNNPFVQQFVAKMHGTEVPASNKRREWKNPYFDINGKVKQCTAPARCRPPPQSARGARRPGTRCYLPTRPMHMTG